MLTITATIGTNPYQTTLSNSRHTLIADENETMHGKDAGPNPSEFLMMSLASCTAITLRMYADRKKWNVTSIDVEIILEKIETTSVFTRNIKVNGNIDQDHKDRLLDIAKACPIHKTLTNPIEINTNLH
jgi:putative redox protein